MATELRWKLADEEGDVPQGTLFDVDDLVERHVGTGEFRGLEFLHVNARRIINEVPAASRMPFRHTINAYRGCSHACSYCLAGETPILLADGRTRCLADLRVGDRIYGTVQEGGYRRYTATTVLAHWSTRKTAYRITLDDGTELIASGDHRFLSDRGWKHVTGAGEGAARRPYLTSSNTLMGTGAFPEAPKQGPDYRRGYLRGMIRGDGPGQAPPADEAAARMTAFLADSGGNRTDAIDWPDQPSTSWCKGFLAGVFDAAGSYSGGILRISNLDLAMLEWTERAFRRLPLDLAVETTVNQNGVTSLRVRGGLKEHLGFFHLVDPAITRTRIIDGTTLTSDAALAVRSIESIGIEIPMYDITTGTGDFIANGVVSHNCFARPTHEYLGLDTGRDFEQKIVVKVNAVERVRAELAARRWGGHHIAMGTNTDPYQRCEGKYHLTRGIIKALSDARNPFSILTKSTLIIRDIDLLAAAAARTDVRCSFSIGTLDEAVWKQSEPGAPHPRRRVEAVRKLTDAGIPCGVLVAPLLPGLSDSPEQVDEVVRACLDAGAVSISGIPLHLRPGVKEHFMGWLGEHHGELVPEYTRRYKRSYLTKAESEGVSALIRTTVQRHRGLSESPRRARSVGAASIRAVTTSSVAAPSPATQLSLLDS